MTNESEPQPGQKVDQDLDQNLDQGVPTPVWVLGWLLWVLEICGFVFLAGCTAILGVEYSKASPTLIVSLLGATVMFIYAIIVTFDHSKTGKPRLLTGITLILVAGFILFGGCAIGLD